MRSPSNAPRVNGLDGSTETTPTLRSSARTCATRALIRLDLPTPGGPVTPTEYAAPVSGYRSATTSYESGSPFSISVIARANARRSPARTPAARLSRVHSLPATTVILRSRQARPTGQEPGSSAAGSGASADRSPPAITSATSAAQPKTTAASAAVPRGPNASRATPANAIPNPSATKFVLMINVNARPRTSSLAPRWTSSALQTPVTPLPIPATSRQIAPIQTFGLTA